MDHQPVRLWASIRNAWKVTEKYQKLLQAAYRLRDERGPCAFAYKVTQILKPGTASATSNGGDLTRGNIYMPYFRSNVLN